MLNSREFSSSFERTSNCAKKTKWFQMINEKNLAVQGKYGTVVPDTMLCGDKPFLSSLLNNCTMESEKFFFMFQILIKHAVMHCDVPPSNSSGQGRINTDPQQKT